MLLEEQEIYIGNYAEMEKAAELLHSTLTVYVAEKIYKNLLEKLKQEENYYNESVEIAMAIDSKKRQLIYLHDLYIISYAFNELGFTTLTLLEIKDKIKALLSAYRLAMHYSIYVDRLEVDIDALKYDTDNYGKEECMRELFGVCMKTLDDVLAENDLDRYSAEDKKEINYEPDNEFDNDPDSMSESSDEQFYDVFDETTDFDDQCEIDEIESGHMHVVSDEKPCGNTVEDLKKIRITTRDNDIYWPAAQQSTINEVKMEMSENRNKIACGINEVVNAVNKAANENAAKYEYVNQPKHYNMYCMPVIDMMEKVFGVRDTAKWCEMTAWKYRQRVGTKPDNSIEQDFDKEKWYLEKKLELENKIENNDFINHDEERMVLDCYMKRLNILAGLDECVKYDRNREKPIYVSNETYQQMLKLRDEFIGFMRSYNRNMEQWANNIINDYYAVMQKKQHCPNNTEVKFRTDFKIKLAELAGIDYYENAGIINVCPSTLDRMFDEANKLVSAISIYEDENPIEWTKWSYSYISKHYTIKED